MCILLEIALKTLFWLTHCFQNWEQSTLHFWKLFLLVKLEDSSFNLIYNLPENSFSTVRGEFLKLPCFAGIFLRTCLLWSLSVWSYPALFCMIFGSFEPVLNKLLIDIWCSIRFSRGQKLPVIVHCPAQFCTKTVCILLICFEQCFLCLKAGYLHFLSAWSFCKIGVQFVWEKVL